MTHTGVDPVYYMFSIFRNVSFFCFSPFDLYTFIFNIVCVHIHWGQFTHSFLLLLTKKKPGQKGHIYYFLTTKRVTFDFHDTRENVDLHFFKELPRQPNVCNSFFNM